MTYYITPGVGMSLAVPGSAQAFETAVVNNNFVLLENGILADRTRLGIFVCTSGTRPSTPPGGQSIIETDTRNTMYWNGARWVPLDTQPNAASAAIRDVLYPAPVAGNQVFRTDLGIGGVPQVYTGSAWRVTGAGMVPIIPTAVTGGTLTGGQVNFTAANPLTVLNAFSADFEFYKLVMRYTKSAGSNLFLQLANGGTPSTGGYYFQSNIDIGTNATVPVTGSGTSSAQIDQGAVPTATQLVMELTDPFLAAPTFGLVQSTAINSTAFTARGSWNHSPSVSFADLNLFPGAGSLAGTLHIYGYSLA